MRGDAEEGLGSMASYVVDEENRIVKKYALVGVYDKTDGYQGLVTELAVALEASDAADQEKIKCATLTIGDLFGLTFSVDNRIDAHVVGEVEGLDEDAIEGIEIYLSRTKVSSFEHPGIEHRDAPPFVDCVNGRDLPFKGNCVSFVTNLFKYANKTILSEEYEQYPPTDADVIRRVFSRFVNRYVAARSYDPPIGPRKVPLPGHVFHALNNDAACTEPYIPKTQEEAYYPPRDGRG